MSEENAQNKAVDTGVNEFVTKPLDFEILERAVTKSLMEGINVSDNSNSR